MCQDKIFYQNLESPDFVVLVGCSKLGSSIFLSGAGVQPLQTPFLEDIFHKYNI
jgi:hypothetical protein